MSCSLRAMHENVGRNDNDELTATVSARQPRIFRQTFPVEHITGAPASFAQHEEPPELEKYVAVHLLVRMSQTFVEQIDPSSQSALDEQLH